MYGITINSISDNNTINNNNFTNNNRNALDNGNNNIFSKNYWDDWNGAGVYFITNGNQDNFPQNQLTGEDYDNDGLPNTYEIENGLNPVGNDSLEDYDNDGITNADEYKYNTKADKADSDDDGIPDKYELLNGLDPLSDDSKLDKDGDWISNIDEYFGNSKANDYWSVPIISFSIFHFLFLVTLWFVTFLVFIPQIILESYRRKSLIKKLNAPNYFIARLMEKGNFKDYHTYLDAQRFHVSDLEEYQFLLELQNLRKHEIENLKK